ncbi:RAD protein [Plasmodium ovale wallikeri]|uniref:RAD protein n=1 Tax=Plasmodium ovale wallikeri TaxID=864142 RepID=A0A1A9AMD1_PLAOA|nr:RAD protein [Plasmodium ovale wallikeri]
MWKINISNIISNDALSELRLGCRSPRLLAETTVSIKESPMQSYLKQKGSGTFFPFFTGIPLYEFCNSKHPTSLSINDIMNITNYCYWFITKKEKCYLLYRYNNYAMKRYVDMLEGLSRHCNCKEFANKLPKNTLKKSLEVCKQGLQKDLENMEKCAHNHITAYMETNKCTCPNFEEFILRYDQMWSNFIDRCEKKGRKYLTDKAESYKSSK